MERIRVRINRLHKVFIVSAALLVAATSFVILKPLIARAFTVTPSVNNNMAGAGTLANPYLITNCQNLQDIQLDLSAYYRLANDIDCSATSTWNNGAGFLPIGSQAYPFMGSLDGRNYTVSNLLVNNSDGSEIYSGIFGATWNGSSILNLKVTDASIYGNVASGTIKTGGLIGHAVGVTIDHVSFSGGVYHNNCGSYVGGLAGFTSAVKISASSVNGDIVVSGSGCTDYDVRIGGMIGLSTDTDITNSYANTDITVNGQSTQNLCFGYNCRVIGGLIGGNNNNGASTVSKSYSSGSVAVTGDSSGSYLVGGILGSALADNITISNSFSTLDTSSLDTNHIAGIAAVSGNGLSNNLFYDKTNNQATSCVLNNPSVTCTAVNTDGSQPNYYKNTSSVAPVTAWDFTNYWQTSAGNLPQLRSATRNIPHATGLATNTIGATTIQLSWNQSAALNPSTTISSFVILCKKSSDTDWDICDTIGNANATFVNLGNLTADTQYDFKMITVGSDGLYSDESATVQGNDIAVPPATNLAIMFPSLTSIHLAWDQAEPSEPGFSVTGYVVYCKKTTDSDWSECATVNDASVKEATINDLDVDAQYQLKVRSFGSFGTHSGESAVASRAKTPLPAATNLRTSILSDEAIKLNWDQPDVATPDQDVLISNYMINCKKSSENVWNICATVSDPLVHTATISGLASQTQYDFTVRTNGSPASLPAESAVVTGTTARAGFILIHDCQELQAIGDRLSKEYELANDIDCGDSVNWDGGKGFDPIGKFDPDTPGGPVIEWFSGIFAGNNYTISNLYCNRHDDAFSLCGLFEFVDGSAIIQDTKLDNFNISAELGAGSLAGLANHSTVTNVHTTNLDIQQDGSEPGSSQAIGGLIGGVTDIVYSNPNQPMTIQKSSVKGSINAINAPRHMGGFIGYLKENDTYSVIKNNYAKVNITTDSATLVGGFLGIASLMPGKSIMSNNYAAGLINITSTDPDLNVETQDGFPAYLFAGSFAGAIINNGLAAGSPTIVNNFAHTTLTSVNPETLPGGFVSAIFGLGDMSSNYFDADQIGTTDCVLPLAGTSNCTPISGQPNYFKNNSTNPPLNAWDFTNIWKTTSEFPVFGTNVTTSITSIPANRLPGGNGGGTVSGGEQPSATGGSAVATSGSGKTGVTATTESQEPGIIGALKKFVRSLPTAVVVAFPYALFGLLLLAVFLLVLEVIRELRRARVLEALINKQRLLAEERDAFWHLAANYLRAPVTLIVGGAEALSERHKNKDTEVISGLATSIQTKVGTIMKKIEGSVSLQSISKIPRGVRAGKVSRVAYFVPLISLAVLLFFANYAASWKNINPGVVGYATQLIIFVIVAVIFYWTLSFLTGSKKKRLQAESIYQRQTTELTEARHELISDTATMLTGDTNKLDMAVKNLPTAFADSAPGALATLREGTDRLREIVHSFALLIMVQESAQISMQKVDLGSMFGSIKAKLAPQITKKNVQITAPSSVLPVSAESEMAQQVIGSIVANAVDYSPAGGTVSIETKNLGDKVLVRISDQGEGISKDQLDHLFQPFVRTDGKSAMDMSHGGFGINLYLDKLIMEKLGGTIDVSSIPGKGTAFTLTWPTAQGS